MTSFTPWKILHLELSAAMPALPFEPNYQGIYAVFCWHSIPLGHKEIPSTQLPMPASQLVNLAWQTIAPAVGDRLLTQGFKAPLPVVSDNPSRDVPPDFHALMELDKPLESLGKQWLQPATTAVLNWVKYNNSSG